MENKNPKTNYQIEEIIEALNELKNGQNNLSEDSQKNFEIIMKKLMKLQEYHKIADMTNQLFEKRLVGIESSLKEISKNRSN